jgi:succinoglycan biosynthesis transport protein ExoP
MEREMDEISLREIIEVVWNGKWVIILVTAIAIVISGIVSFFIINPVYEARSTLIVSNEKLEGHPVPPSMQTYVEQVKNHTIMSRTIDQLGLRQQDISINDLREKIDVNIVKDTNLIRIVVRDKDPKLASDIANAVTLHFVDFMTNQAMEQLITSSEHMIDQIDLELKVSLGALKKVDEELAKTPEILVTNKSLSEDAFLHSVISENQNQSNAEAGGLQMRSEATNPVYISLQQSAANLNIDISKLENKRNELDEKIKTNQLMVQESLTIVSRAIEPENPVGPKKLLNIAIAGVVGGMTSLFIVFILHYWRTSAHTSSPYRKIGDAKVDSSM